MFAAPPPRSDNPKAMGRSFSKYSPTATVPVVKAKPDPTPETFRHACNVNKKKILLIIVSVNATVQKDTHMHRELNETSNQSGLGVFVSSQRS